MNARTLFIPILFICTTTLFAAVGADSYRLAVKAEREGAYDQAAQSFERAARRQTGKRSAVAWFRADRNWIEPGNPKLSYARAIACFQRVDQAIAAPAVARETKTWISVLSRLVSAEEAALEVDRLKSALEDAEEGSRALQSPSAR